MKVTYPMYVIEFQYHHVDLTEQLPEAESQKHAQSVE